LVNVIARTSFARAWPGVVEVGDPVGEHAGLARAGAGEDEQRAVAVRDRLALRRVHPLEEALDVLIGGGHLGLSIGSGSA
jgi:hypothetical protein